MTEEKGIIKEHFAEDHEFNFLDRGATTQRAWELVLFTNACV